MQVHGVHHFDAFPPVAKLSNFQTTLADAACYDSKVEKSTATDVRQCFAVYLFFFELGVLSIGKAQEMYFVTTTS